MMIDFGKFFLLLLAFWWLIRQAKWLHRDLPALPFSSLQSLQDSHTLKVRLYRLQPILFWTALFFFALPLANPRIIDKNALEESLKIPAPDKGIAIYFLIDHSGSMIENVETPDGKKIPKIDLVKELTKKFIEGSKEEGLTGRQSDMLGLIQFARKPDILCPLTLNHQDFLQKLSSITPVANEEDDGTAIGYAIFKTVNLIVSTKYFAERLKEKNKPSYTIKNQIIIVLTDGLQSPSPLDLNNPYRFMKEEKALSYAAANGVRVYFAGVDPVLASPEFADEMKRIKEGVLATKGAYFLTTGSMALNEIYSQIDSLEKSEIPKQAPESMEGKAKSLLPECLLVGIVLLAAAVFLETSITKLTP
jgi:Ca-activated chloride channel homolog